MSTGAFDTLSAARELEAAGIERRQAEAIAKVINHGDERAATKADLDTAIAALEARLTWRLVAIAAPIVTAVELIPGLD